MRILIVADDPLLTEELPPRLRADGHQVSVYQRVAQLPAVVLDMGSHLVLVDPHVLPASRLLSCCRSIRRESGALLLLVSPTPLRRADRQRLLDAGADDVLDQPLHLEELQARLRAALRRHPLAGGEGQERLPVTDDLDLDVAGQRLLGKDRRIALSQLEFRLLAYLAHRPDAVVSREELLDVAWADRTETLPREVDVYIRYLRRKLEPDPARPRYLCTVWGQGYRYTPPTRDIGILQNSGDHDRHA